MKVATTVEFLAGYPMRSFEAFDFGVRLLLQTFQSAEFSFVIRQRFEKLSDQGTQRSIPFGRLDSGFSINFIRK
jgi:hypothetical protein